MCCFVLTSRIWCFLCLRGTCNVLILSQIISACSMSIAKYIIYTWNSHSFFDCFLTVDEHLENPTTLNLSGQIWWISEAKQLVSTLRLWSSISSPQIRQSEARCWTRISIRQIKLFWLWKRKKAQTCTNARKSNNTAMWETREWKTYAFWNSEFKNCPPRF